MTAIRSAIQATDFRPEALLTKLQAIETSRPWLQPLVLVSRKGAGQLASPTASFDALLTAAEGEEQRLRRPGRAAVLYSKAAALASTGRQRTEALNGQARSELKSGQPARARETYATLIAAADTLDHEQARRSLLARHQLLDCDTVLGDRDAYTTHALDVYRFLIGHRFVLDGDTYDFYTRRILETLAATALGSGQRAVVEQLRQRARQLDPLDAPIRNLSGEPGNRGNPVVALISIDQPRADNEPAVLVAHPWGPANVTALLRRLLSEPGPWSELGIALLDADAHAVFSSMAPVAATSRRAAALRVP